MSQNIIEVANLQKRIPVNRRKFICITKRILNELKIRNILLSIAFLNNRQIKRINYKYKGINKSTDILAFNLHKNRHELFGDLIISIQKAGENAKIFKTSLEKEVVLYIAHGILHLVGYNDKNAKCRRLMEQKQFKILDQIYGKARPCR